MCLFRSFFHIIFFSLPSTLKVCCRRSRQCRMLPLCRGELVHRIHLDHLEEPRNDWELGRRFCRMIRSETRLQRIGKRSADGKQVISWRTTMRSIALIQLTSSRLDNMNWHQWYRGLLSRRWTLGERFLDIRRRKVTGDQRAIGQFGDVCFKTDVGIGSAADDLSGSCRTASITSSTLTDEKAANETPGWMSAGWRHSCLIAPSKLSLQKTDSRPRFQHQSNHSLSCGDGLEDC